MKMKKKIENLLKIKKGYLKKVHYVEDNKKIIIFCNNDIEEKLIKEKHGKDIKKYYEKVVFKRNNSKDYIKNNFITYILDEYSTKDVDKDLEILLFLLLDNFFWRGVKNIRKKWGLPKKPKPTDYEKNYKHINKLRTKRHKLRPYNEWLKKNFSDFTKAKKIDEQTKGAVLSLLECCNFKEERKLDSWLKDINLLLKKNKLHNNFFETVETIIVCDSVPLGLCGLNYFKKSAKKNIKRDLLIKSLHTMGYKPKVIEKLVNKELNIKIEYTQITSVINRFKKK